EVIAKAKGKRKKAKGKTNTRACCRCGLSSFYLLPFSFCLFPLGTAMAGKRTASATTLKADPRFNSVLASKFINCLMWQGKKATAQRIFYGALDQIKKRIPEANPIEVFQVALENVKPPVELRSRRVGGATYQVPMQVSPIRKQSLAIRWIISAARGK